MDEKQVIDDIAFVLDEFFSNPIESGALKGELNPSLAIEKMREIGHVLSDYKNGNLELPSPRTLTKEEKLQWVKEYQDSIS